MAEHRAEIRDMVERVEMVERHTQLAELEAALRDARSGDGSVVLVTGEAGVGKTTLVRHFSSEASSESRFLWGMCDELATPRPLGPFRDIAAKLGGAASVAARSGATALLDLVLQELSRSPFATVVVVEDAHWADEATVDGIRFLGRRIRTRPAVLIVTFRGDEVPADHPMRLAAGAIPPDDIRRVGLPPLSLHGVAMLAGRDDVKDLYQLTGGNPFYVKELLAEPGASVPENVQGAVVSRVRRLSAQGLATVETASVMPGRAEWSIIEACGVSNGVDEAARSGVLQIDADAVRFSHELTRRAVESGLTPRCRRAVHFQVLNILAERNAEPARLAHHAVMADDPAAVALYAPVAARQASSLNAHRESAAHFRQALHNLESYTAESLAKLWYDYARECWLTGAHHDAERALQNAIDIHTDIGDQVGLGTDLTLLADVLWNLRRGEVVLETATRAINVLSQVGSSELLAAAYAQRAKIALVDRRNDEAIEWGEKAIGLAREHDDTAVLVYALVTVGTARWISPPFDNRVLLESLDLARAEVATAQVGRGYANLVAGFMQRVEHDQAEHYISEGLAYCAEHDLLTSHSVLMGHRSTLHQFQGRWDEARDDAMRIAAESGGRRVPALSNIFVHQVRRGTDDAVATLKEAQRLAERGGDSQDLLPVGLARLEFAWLHGVLDEKVDLAAKLLVLAERTGVPVWIGEAALWLHRAGMLDEPPAAAFEPYSLHVRGRWREAANAWAKLRCPYQQADALADAPEPGPLLDALRILDGLGAKPRVVMVRARLVDMGVTKVPRGPQESTRSNPAGLTLRQAEVLQLLAQDLTYQEIAQRLYLSVKTVDHHAAAVRAKLDATDRDEAIAAARRLGLLDADNA